MAQAEVEEGGLLPTLLSVGMKAAINNDDIAGLSHPDGMHTLDSHILVV